MAVTKDNDFYGREKVWRIMLKIAPPVMLAQLIQALYNIVDSFFVGMYSDDALTALTVIYPLQLIIIALAVGTGVGVNTYMAQKYAHGEVREAEYTAGCGTLLELLSWAVFAVIATIFMRPYVMTSTSTPLATEYAVTYGRIVSIGSIGVFLEGNFTKVHQSRGNMLRPMIAQITAAVIVSFGALRRPPAVSRMGHFIGRIYFFGYSSIFMQALYTVYILALNIILAKFSDEAVVVLGLYYKLQRFFFIPLFGLQTCIVPLLSYNYARADHKRCRQVMNISFLISSVFMLVGVVCFVFFPEQMISIFSDNAMVHEIGRMAFPIIGAGFISAVFGLIMPTFFQAIGRGGASTFLSLFRQIICLVPIFWALSFIGLNYTWLSFPISETVSGAAGLIMYASQLKKWRAEDAARLSSGTNV